jgi:cytochrome c oxidase subunit 2
LDAALSLSSRAASSVPVGAPTGLVDTRAEYQHVFDIYVPIALGVFALIVIATLLAVLIYRRRPPERAARWYEHDRLEGGYALLLVATVAFLLYITFTAEHRVDNVAARERPALVVNVTGSKWEWHFNYPAYGIDLYSGAVGHQDLVVPTGEAIRFRLASVDVIHAFWIPQLRYKHDLIPGSIQSSTLTFSRPGVFAGQCAEFCGLLHSDMIFNVRALSPAEFMTWARSQRAAGGAAA